jgi:cytochrome c peroxidase
MHIMTALLRRGRQPSIQGSENPDLKHDLVLEFNEPREDERKSVNEFSLMEYNFALFFGLAMQLYEATLVSDHTPLDQFLEGDSRALTAQQQEGLRLFQDTTTVRCINCHGGAEFTHASVRNVEPNRLFRRAPNILDNGFFNIGVRPTFEDLGVGGNDPFGTPLAEARLASQGRFDDQNLDPPLSSSNIPGVDGAFKAPGLRNVELTAPYFHNGGQSTLAQVIDFYSRGGDFQPIHGREGENRPLSTLNLSPESKAALVAFLKALTDERVRSRRAPFDHLELFVPDGHPGDSVAVTDDGTGKATDSLVRIPAVGSDGGPPLPSFLAPPAAASK